MNCCYQCSKPLEQWQEQPDAVCAQCGRHLCDRCYGNHGERKMICAQCQQPPADAQARTEAPR